MASKSGDVNKVNLFKQQKKADTSKTHFAVETYFLKKSIRKLKGGGSIRTKFPVWIGQKMTSKLKPVAILAKSRLKPVVGPK